MLQQLLNQALEKGTLIGVATDSSDIGRYVLGWVLALSDEFYCMLTLDEYARLDSIHLGYIEDILRVYRKGPYIEAFERMAQGSKGDYDLQQQIPLDLEQALAEAHRTGEVITLVDRNRVPISGFVKDVDADCVLLQAVETNGRSVDETALRLASVLRLEMRGPSEWEINSLYSRRQSLGLT